MISRAKMLVVGAFIIGLAAEVSAGPTQVVWSSTAAACVPADTAIQSNLYLTTGGSVKHASTQTANIVMYCPVAQPGVFSSTPSKIWVTYRDGDGDGLLTFVDVSLVYMDGTGSITTVASFLSSAGNCKDGSTGATCSYAGDTGIVENYYPFTHTFDTLKTYYIRIDMTRSATTVTDIIYRVMLGQ